VALILVALVGLRDLRRPLILAAAGGALGILGLMFGVTPFGELRALPVLRNIHFGNYFGMALDFALALVAAAGFERLTERGMTTLRAWGGVAVGLAAVLALIVLASSVGAAGHPAFAEWRRQYVFLVLILFAAATLVFAAASDQIARHRGRLAWALMSLVLVEGLANCQFPRQKRWDVWRNPPPYVEYLQQHAGLGRVFSIGGALYANSGSAFQIIQVDSLMAFNAPRMYALYRRYAKTAMPLFLRHAEQVPPEGVLDAAAVSHIAVATDLPGVLADLEGRGHERVFDDGLVRIFRRATPSRYFFTTEYEAVSRRRSLDAIAIARPPRTIVVESDPPFPAHPNAQEVPVRVERFSNNRVHLSLVAPERGFVYMSESLLPGWEATVNGQNVPFQPANHAFRAVQVAAGPVQIELKYVPPGLRPGLGVSAAALLVVVGLLAYPLRSRL
jgi:hypothetical protein